MYTINFNAEDFTYIVKLDGQQVREYHNRIEAYAYVQLQNKTRNT